MERRSLPNDQFISTGIKRRSRIPFEAKESVKVPVREEFRYHGEALFNHYAVKRGLTEFESTAKTVNSDCSYR